MQPSRDSLQRVYGRRDGTVDAQADRYAKLAARFFESFPDQQELRFFSAPGRAEIGGNHTDHQHGRVLAASVSVDTVAAAMKNDSEVIRVLSEGYAPVTVDISTLQAWPEERGTMVALIRGCAASMSDLGMPIGGFDATVTSTVLGGSGLSSSAAFEVLVCTILDGLFGPGNMSPILRAQISQYAENQYFGKPSGLMDQMASSVGGIVSIDFEREAPEVSALTFDFAAKGYQMAVVNTGGSHDDLTDAYASIRSEMEAVAALFGKAQLRAVEPAQFEAELPKLRGKVSDRALLRAMHFFAENARVPRMVDALEMEDLGTFFRLIIESGESSWMLLQNVWASPAEQPIALALALSSQMLKGQGAWRVHGGGFAGTILAFVPHAIFDAYTARMDSVFGQGACQALDIRQIGATELA